MTVPFLLLTVGPPASGKSTWCARHFIADRSRQYRQVFGLDEARGWASGDEADRQATGDALRIIDAIVSARMRHQLGTVVDNTSTEPEHRDRLARFARHEAVPTAAMVFLTPLDVCLRNNDHRDRWVPPDAIKAKWHRVNATLPLGTPAAEVDWTCWLDTDGTVRYVDEPPGPFASQWWFVEARKEVVR